MNNENDVIKASSSRGKRKLRKIYLIFAALGVTDILVHLIVAMLEIHLTTWVKGTRVIQQKVTGKSTLSHQFKRLIFFVK